MSFKCEKHGWEHHNTMCPICFQVTTSSTTGDTLLSSQPAEGEKSAKEISDIERCKYELLVEEYFKIPLTSSTNILSINDHTLVDFALFVHQTLQPSTPHSSEGMAEALTVEHVRELYTSETGEGWMVTPVCHGEKGFASWEYQLWLERKLASLSPGVEDGSGWVKVEDRLPENAGWVNDTVMFWSKKHGHALIGCYDFEFDDWTQQPWAEGAEKLKSSDVTHWRPLPTPPDVEDNQTKKQ